MRGQTGADTAPYGNTTTTAGSNTASGAPHAIPGATHAPGFGAGKNSRASSLFGAYHGMFFVDLLLGTTSGALHPNHHREDAVAGIPQDELRDVQSHAAQSYSQSQEPQGWHTNVSSANPTTTASGAGFSDVNGTANANYATETGSGGAYGPGRNQKIGNYSHEGNETVAKNVQFDRVDGGLAHDQGHSGCQMEMRGPDGRSGLN